MSICARSMVLSQNDVNVLDIDELDIVFMRVAALLIRELVSLLFGFVVHSSYDVQICECEFGGEGMERQRHRNMEYSTGPAAFGAYEP